MVTRKALDISAYLIVGPENTKGRPVTEIVRAAVRAGFACVQVRSKTISARELIVLTAACAKALEAMGAKDRVALLVNDRLDVALAARMQGIAVDGVHVGQSDVPPEACRQLLGPEAIVGLSAPREKLIRYAREAVSANAPTAPQAACFAGKPAKDLSPIDYLGVGPLHPTASKPDAGLLPDGSHRMRALGELEELASVSPLPVVAGGGVTAKDLPALKKTGVAGFFVISAVAGAEDPEEAARELVGAWRA